jgi:hypothetical protein
MILLILVNVSASPHKVDESDSVTKYAIVCGQADTRILKGADGDARLMVSILKQNGFKSNNIKSLIGGKLNSESLLDALVWLNDVSTPNSEIVILFAGESMPLSHYAISQMLPIEYEKMAILIMRCYAGRLIPVYEGANRLIITSSDITTVSGDRKPLTVWGQIYLDRGIKREQADSDGDGLISLQDALDYYLQSLSMNKEEMISDNTGEFYL